MSEREYIDVKLDYMVGCMLCNVWKLFGSWSDFCITQTCIIYRKFQSCCADQSNMIGNFMNFRLRMDRVDDLI